MPSLWCRSVITHPVEHCAGRAREVDHRGRGGAEPAAGRRAGRAVASRLLVEVPAPTRVCCETAMLRSGHVHCQPVVNPWELRLERLRRPAAVLPAQHFKEKQNTDPNPERSNGRLAALDSDAALSAAWARHAGMIYYVPRSARVGGHGVKAVVV